MHVHPASSRTPSSNPEQWQKGRPTFGYYPLLGRRTLLYPLLENACRGRPSGACAETTQLKLRDNSSLLRVRSKAASHFESCLSLLRASISGSHRCKPSNLACRVHRVRILTPLPTNQCLLFISASHQRCDWHSTNPLASHLCFLLSGRRHNRSQIEG